jgi:hypothetical protein
VGDDEDPMNAAAIAKLEAEDIEAAPDAEAALA